MLKAIVILSLVALLSAAPADDKQTLSRPSPINPDVISDPKPNTQVHTADDGHEHTHPAHANLQSSNVNGGATAHPLHKRESPKVVDQKPAAPQSNLNNAQKSTPQVNAPKAQANGQQRPVNNNQKSAQSPSNNQQKPLVQAQEPIAAQKPISNSRVTRDAPTVVDQKPAAPQPNLNNGQKSQPQVNAPKAQVNGQQRPVNNNQKSGQSPSNNNQKPKQSQSPSNNNQKSGQSPSNNQQKPLVQAQQPIAAQKTPQQPISNARVTRDAPHVAEQKPAAPQLNLKSQPSVDSHLNLKSQPTAAPQSTNQKSGSAQLNTEQKPVANHARVARDVAPRVAEQKPIVPQSNDAKKDLPTPAPAHTVNNHKAGQDSIVHKSAPQQPIVPQKQPISNSRVSRGAPNPAEQSKYVPSSHQASEAATTTTTESNGFKTGVFKIESLTTTSSPSEIAHKELSDDAKKVQSAAAQHTSEHTQSLPLHKRETPSTASTPNVPSNVRDNTSSQSYDSYGNQAPSYVHPKPIEEVLKIKPKSAHHEDTDKESSSPVTKEADPVTSKPAKSS